jgi:hypothetical protein
LDFFGGPDEGSGAPEDSVQEVGNRFELELGLVRNISLELIPK